jgi:ABC-type Co2+ transport system permease subunit
MGDVVMTIRFAIACMVCLMVQAVLFGIGAVLILATPLKHQAMELMPWMIAVTFAISAPFSWWLAPRLRARYWREHRNLSAADKALSALS